MIQQWITALLYIVSCALMYHSLLGDLTKEDPSGAPWLWFTQTFLTLSAALYSLLMHPELADLHTFISTTLLGGFGLLEWDDYLKREIEEK